MKNLLLVTLIFLIQGCAPKITPYEPYIQPTTDGYATVTVDSSNHNIGLNKFEVRLLVDDKLVNKQAPNNEFSETYSFKIAPGIRSIIVSTAAANSGSTIFLAKEATDPVVINVQPGEEYKITATISMENNSSGNATFNNLIANVKFSGSLSQINLGSLELLGFEDSYSNEELSRDIINTVILPSTY